MTTPRTQRTRLLPDLDLTVREAGHGSPVLVLHGGAGPDSVTPILDHLAADHHVLAPSHPGWNGTPRPDRLRHVTDLASTYLTLLDHRSLRDASVVGSSFGGWIAAEMALQDPVDHTDPAIPNGSVGRIGRVGRLVLLDAIGPTVERATGGGPPRAGRATPPAGNAPPTPGPAPADLALLQTYTGPAMQDPELLHRLADVHIPALVLWGADDPILPPAYGAAYAAAFARGRFHVIPGAGHLPTSEAPEPTFAAIDRFLHERHNEHLDERTMS